MARTPGNKNSLESRFRLIKMKLEILRLKADDYNWQCHTPDAVKKQLEEILAEIDQKLKQSKEQ